MPNCESSGVLLGIIADDVTRLVTGRKNFVDFQFVLTILRIQWFLVVGKTLTWELIDTRMFPFVESGVACVR